MKRAIALVLVASIAATVGVTFAAGFLAKPEPERAEKLPYTPCTRDLETYTRRTTPLLEKYHLMTVCDAQLGAVNLIRLDDVELTTRPVTGPVYINGCVATAPGYKNVASFAGCRVVIDDVTEDEVQLILNTELGYYSYE
jgi:hypothetical protein